MTAFYWVIVVTYTLVFVAVPIAIGVWAAKANREEPWR